MSSPLLCRCLCASGKLYGSCCKKRGIVYLETLRGGEKVDKIDMAPQLAGLRSYLLHHFGRNPTWEQKLVSIGFRV